MLWSFQSSLVVCFPPVCHLLVPAHDQIPDSVPSTFWWPHTYSWYCGILWLPFLFRARVWFVFPEGLGPFPILFWVVISSGRRALLPWQRGKGAVLYFKHQHSDSLVLREVGARPRKLGFQSKRSGLCPFYLPLTIVDITGLCPVCQRSDFFYYSFSSNCSLKPSLPADLRNTRRLKQT